MRAVELRRSIMKILDTSTLARIKTSANSEPATSTPHPCFMFKLRIAKVGIVALSILLAGFFSAHAQSDVTQPGDPIIASSSNSPGSEGVANAIDGKPTKYLNFDAANDAKVTGFVVTPSVGATTIIGTTMTSANDA